jgi:hypothetical protein
MFNEGSLLFWLAPAAFLCFALFLVARWSFVVSQPDEWLLRIHNGRLVNAGIGISVWRRPGDVIARFSSTMQRAGFSVEAITQEHLYVLIDGFVLWTVSSAGDGPFQAFSKIGIANLDNPPPGLKSKKHLLTSLQYHAFQGMIAAEVQRYAATVSLNELLIEQDKFVSGLQEQLAKMNAPFGTRIEQFQILQVQPKDPALLRELSTGYEEQSRENAAQIRLETAERMKKREIDSTTSLAKEESSAHRDQKAHEAQVELELEQRRAELLDAQHHVRRQQIEHEGELQMEQLEIERKTKVRMQEIERERQLAAEVTQYELAEARIKREDAEAKVKLARMREEAEAQRDAMLAVNGAEEKKPQAVRDYELARLTTEKVSHAIASLPIHDARWVTVGNESPIATIAAAIAEVRSLFGDNHPAAMHTQDKAVKRSQS